MDDTDEGPDLSLPYCTYITTHPAGFWYAGKGITSKVLSGKYIGSGVRLNLSFTTEKYARSKWVSTVLETFPNEELAYLAEERLVTGESLADPFCMNMKVGGLGNRWNGDSAAVLRRIEKRKKEAKAAAKKAIALAAKEEQIKQRAAERLARAQKKEQKKADQALARAHFLATVEERKAAAVAKMAASRRGMKFSDEHRAKLSEAGKRPLTPAQLLALRASTSGSITCVHCGVTTNRLLHSRWHGGNCKEKT